MKVATEVVSVPESVSESKIQEVYFVTCPTHGMIPLSKEEYTGQLELNVWLCPKCGKVSAWSGRARLKWRFGALLILTMVPVMILTISYEIKKWWHTKHQGVNHDQR